MARSFSLPDLGEGIHEGEILAVHVETGQSVKEGDVILEVETDKAAVEIPSPYTGTIVEIFISPGDLVHVGDVLMSFSNGDDGAEAPSETPEAAEEKTVEAEMHSAPPSPKSRKDPVPASPATRRLARELGVALDRVTPTGPAGLVTAEDVRAAAEGGPSREPARVPSEPVALTDAGMIASESLPDFSRWGPIERVPFRSIRRATARQMSLAWSLIPHVNSQDELDVTDLERFRKKHKADIEARGGRLTMTVFALKAVATALKRLPHFSATLDTASQEIIIKNYFHIGVAVNTDQGLVVPVIRDVDRKSIRELAHELNDMALRARERKLTLEEMQGGTFTITNIGAMGGGFFAPIINYPQVAIMGMGRARLKPWVVESQNGSEIVPRRIMPLVLTIDHRVLDGADAIRFLQVVKEVLEDPDELLMSMV
jgi:pyruvate dehydrogenase E2 component (dihydrolipoamide acetyltransferase)